MASGPVGSGCLLGAPPLTQPVSLRSFSPLKQGVLDKGQASMGQAVRVAAGSKASGHIGVSMQNETQFRSAVEQLDTDVGQDEGDSTPPADAVAAARQWSVAPLRGALTRSGRAATSAGTLMPSQGQANTSHGVQVA